MNKRKEKYNNSLVDKRREIIEKHWGNKVSDLFYYLGVRIDSLRWYFYNKAVKNYEQRH